MNAGPRGDPKQSPRRSATRPRYPRPMPRSRFSLAAWVVACCLLGATANANSNTALVSASSNLSPWVRAALRQQSNDETYREATAKLREDLARDEIERRERALRVLDEAQRRDRRALGELAPAKSTAPRLDYDPSSDTLRTLERRRAQSGIREARQELRNDQISDDLARERQREHFVQRTERLLQRDALTNGGTRPGSGARALRSYQRDRALGDHLREVDRFVNDR